MAASYWSKARISSLSRRRFLAFSSASSAALLLTACGSGDSSSSAGRNADGNLVAKPVDTTKQAKRNGVMKDRTFGDPPTLDIFTANNPLNAVNPHSYSTLVQFKPGYLKPAENELAPDLAESWEYSPDGLQITLKLRQGVKWHNKPPVNGRGFDIDDLLFSWDRFTKKSSSRAAVANVVDPRAPIVSLTSVDPRTVVIKLKEPLVYALALFATNSSGGVIMVPKETDTTFDSRGDMIGTGPFVMTNYTPSVGFTFKRNPDYWDKDYALVDQIELPIVADYSAALAQFKAGNIYSFGSYNSVPNITPEDVLPVKREEPRILIYEGDLGKTATTGSRLVFGWLPVGKSPFLDERVRQAVSLAWDRDSYFDAFYNVSKFAAAGLPVTTLLNSHLDATNQGWWLDPKGKDFGPNSRFFQHDPAEAKKLLAAAGYPNGLTATSSVVSGPELPYAKFAEVMDGMERDVGITTKSNGLDYASQYIPLYRDASGQFEGWAYKSTAGGATGGDAVGIMAQEFWSKAGVTFHGFSTTGQNDKAGDPQVDQMIEKARIERDTEARRALVFDLQRYLAKPMYSLNYPGPATGFTVAWPALGNFRIWRAARLNYQLWVDDTKAPFKSA